MVLHVTRAYDFCRHRSDSITPSSSPCCTHLCGKSSEGAVITPHTPHASCWRQNRNVLGYCTSRLAGGQGCDPNPWVLMLPLPGRLFACDMALTAQGSEECACWKKNVCLHQIEHCTEMHIETFRFQ